MSLYMRRAIEELRGLLTTATVEPDDMLGPGLGLGLGAEFSDALDDAFSFEAGHPG